MQIQNDTISGATLNSPVLVTPALGTPSSGNLSNCTGLVPTSYDSGWFAVTNANAYSKTHNLGTTKLLATVWFSINSDGTGATQGIENYPDATCSIKDLTTTTCKLQTGTGYSGVTYADNGTWTLRASGYARIILTAA
ncbi:MAG: hypothetical protein VKL60_18080 [Sphaerospermopsis sp.]|nr:hypothetical protein [Sphaerospermopsis sp.]